MNYGLKAWTIVGYTYNAETYCENGIILAMGEYQRSDESAEHALDRIAMRRGIDRMDERSFDSDDFPKVIFASQVESPEICGSCGSDLIIDR